RRSTRDSMPRLTPHLPRSIRQRTILYRKWPNTNRRGRVEGFPAFLRDSFVRRGPVESLHYLADAVEGKSLEGAAVAGNGRGFEEGIDDGLFSCFDDGLEERGHRVVAQYRDVSQAHVRVDA